MMEILYGVGLFACCLPMCSYHIRSLACILFLPVSMTGCSVWLLHAMCNLTTVFLFLCTFCKYMQQFNYSRTFWHAICIHVYPVFQCNTLNIHLVLFRWSFEHVLNRNVLIIFTDKLISILLLLARKLLLLIKRTRISVWLILEVNQMLFGCDLSSNTTAFLMFSSCSFLLVSFYVNWMRIYESLVVVRCRLKILSED